MTFSFVKLNSWKFVKLPSQETLTAFNFSELFYFQLNMIILVSFVWLVHHLLSSRDLGESKLLFLWFKSKFQWFNDFITAWQNHFERCFTLLAFDMFVISIKLFLFKSSEVTTSSVIINEKSCKMLDLRFKKLIESSLVFLNNDTK